MAQVHTEIVKDHIAIITLDNPPVNAVNWEFMEEVIATFDRLNDLDEVRVAVVTGKGKNFCGGVDLRRRVEKPFETGQRWGSARLAREMSYSIMECKKPVIAAVNGAAMGAGMGIAVSSDIILCADNATFGLPEIDVGLMGGGRHAMRVFGHSLTRRMMFTGYRVKGPELYRRGIVEACVPVEELLPAAMEIAEQIAAKSPLAVRISKHAAATIEGMGIRDGYRFEQNMTADIAKTEDAKEAMLAFVEKRAPKFVGR